MSFFRTFSCFLRFLRAFDDLCALFDHLFLDIVIVKCSDCFGADFGGFGVDNSSVLCSGVLTLRLCSEQDRITRFINH